MAQENEVEEILYEMYSHQPFAPGDVLMTAVSQMAPSGWVDLCCRGAAKTQAENVQQYIDNTITKEELIYRLKLGKVDPIVMSQVIEIAEIKRGEKK